MVSRQSASGFSGVGTLKADAMKEAYEQCQETGKRVEVVETIDTKPPYIFGYCLQKSSKPRIRILSESRALVTCASRYTTGRAWIG